MTKESLSQLLWLKKEIALEQRRMHELDALIAGSASGAAGFPSLDEEERAYFADELQTCRNQVRAKLLTAMHEYQRLNEYIASIDDSLMRQILSLRYINGFSWQQIAFCIGEHDEQYPRRKHQSFLAHADQLHSTASVHAHYTRS